MTIKRMGKGYYGSLKNDSNGSRGSGREQKYVLQYCQDATFIIAKAKKRERDFNQTQHNV